MSRKATKGSFKKGDKRAGRPKGVQNKATLEVKEFARGLIDSPEYQAALLARIQAGTLSPGVETLLWHYSFGRPKEQVELSNPDGTLGLRIERVIIRPPSRQD